MSKNLLDANNWANPKLGNMVLDALFGEMPRFISHPYRPVGMSARELMVELGVWETKTDGYYDYALSDDRSTVIVTLDLEKKGASPCSFGYLDNRIAEITAFWTGKSYTEKTHKPGDGWVYDPEYDVWRKE